MCLGLGAYWTARLAWAEHLSRSSDLSSRVEAVRLCSSATLYERLAEKREELGGDPLPDLEQAVALEPENAAWRLRLGLRAEWSGDLGLAERSYREAARLSRQYQPRYLLAQYYFRRQNADLFGEWSRAAFATAYGDVAPLLDLCWRMQPNAQWLVEQSPAGRPEIASQFLLFLARRHQTGAGLSLALRLTATAKSEDLPALLEYCNQCLYEGDGASAAGVWNALCLRRLLPGRPLDAARGVSLTNGSFEHPPTGTGFDWRLEKAPWLRFAQFNGGLRLTFSGNQPESCLLASEYVPVLPGSCYRLRLAPQPPGMPSPEGLEWMVYDPSGKALATGRTTDRWLTFTPATAVVRLGLIYQRPLGSTRLEGSVSIAGAQLELVR